MSTRSDQETETTPTELATLPRRGFSPSTWASCGWWTEYIAQVTGPDGPRLQVKVTSSFVFLGRTLFFVFSGRGQPWLRKGKARWKVLVAREVNSLLKFSITTLSKYVRQLISETSVALAY
jgi:hypothetical protein